MAPTARRPLDAQVHLAPGEDAAALIAAMDEAGVDGALVTNQSKYGPDNDHQLAAVAAYPERLALVAGVDPAAADVADRVEALRATAGVVGVRVVVNPRDVLEMTNLPQETRDRIAGEIARWESGGYEPLLDALERHGMPLLAYAPGRAAELDALAGRHPSLSIVVDHLNLPHTPLAVDRDDDVLAELPQVMRLADRGNVAVKMSGTPAISREPYPYADVRPPLVEVVRAFGADRVMWGSDFSVLTGRATYRECVDHLADWTDFTDDELDALLGGTLAQTFEWEVNNES